MSRYDRWSHADMPGAEENRRIQAGIDAVMRDIIADPRKDPTAMPPSERVTVVGAPQVTTAFEPEIGRGWQRERPITCPPGQDAIERLVNAALPPGPVQQLEGIRVTIARMGPEERERASAWLAGRNDHPFYAEVRAMLEEAIEGAASAEEADR
jgi:hypothetical protein